MQFHHARRRAALNLLVALAMLAAVCGTRVAQADEAGRLPLLQPLAAAAEVVVIPRDTLNALVWHALSTRGTLTETAVTRNASGVTDAADDPWDARLRTAERIFAHNVFARLIARTRGTPLGAGTSLLQLMEAYEARIGYTEEGGISNSGIRTLGDCVGAFFFEAAQDPEYREIARQIYGEMRNESGFRDATGKPATDVDYLITRELRQFDFEGSLIRRYNESVLLLVQEAQANDGVRQMLQKRAGPGTPPLLGFDAAKWLQENATDPISQQLSKLQEQNGGLQMSIDDLTALTQSEFDKLNASLEDMRGILVGIDKQQKDILAYLKDQKAREQAEALAAAKAKEHERKLKAAQSGIFIVSTLIGLKYPERAKQITVVGNAVIQVGETYRQWMSAVAGLSASGKIFNLSTVIATGNMLGAVMSVASLFGGNEPSPEQMILQEIAKLRQEIGQLRSEMHDRFDRVDRGLNLIFTTMHDRFDQIDVQLGRIVGDIHELRLSLASMSASLHRIELNNVAFLDSLGRRPLLIAMNGSLGYRQRTGNVLAYEPGFVDAENAFYTWGVSTAFDALAAGPQQRDYRDSQVLDELASLPLDSNLNYLNGWLLANGYPGLSGARLPGMRDWVIAARAYATLGLENPQHLVRIDRNRLQALDKVGQDMEAALLRISAPVSASGAISHSVVLSSALAYYNDKQQTLHAALATYEQAYLVELTSTMALDRGTPFELFGGVEQPIQHKTQEFMNFSCAATAPVLETPGNLGRIVHGYASLTLADYLRLPADALKVCLSAEWTNIVVECFNGNCRMIANLSTTLDVYAGASFAGRQVYTEASKRRVAIGAQAMQYAYSHWSELKPGFEAATGSGGPITFVDDTPRQKAVALLEEALAGHQKRLYARMADALSPGGVLAGVGKDLAGGKKLFASYVTLGMPNALERDDLVHGLLFGSQGLVDDVTAHTTYALSATQPISGAELAVNQRLVLARAGAERVGAVDAIITAYVRALGTSTALTSAPANPTHVEDFAAIADARRDLRLALLFSASSGTTGAGQRVFIPVVSRK